MNYKVIANWEIAEHKSQGLTQMSMNDGDVEKFWYFALNGTVGLDKCTSLFKALSYTPYVAKNYFVVKHNGRRDQVTGSN
jgi:hypothetical protein